MNAPIPVRPIASYPIAAGSLARAAFMVFLSATSSRDPLSLLRERYPTDRNAAAYLEMRAAISGATTATPAWAGSLVGESVEAFLDELGPTSAAARLQNLGGLRITLEPGTGTLRIPGWADPPDQAPWVQESFPIPLYADELTSLFGGPVRKLGIMAVYSRELARLSSAERIFRTRLRDMAGVSYDLAVFGTQAASPSAAAGLLNGVAPIVAPGPVLETLAALGAAVATNGSGEVCYITRPELALQAKLRLDPGLGMTVLASRGVPAGRVIAVDPLGLVWLTGGLPDIEAADQSTVVMSDAPGNLGTVGTPNVVGAPAISMFQTAQTALRMLLDVAVAKREGAVAFANAVDWTPPP